MIIAVIARGGDLEAAVDTRFGRAAAFVAMDTDTGSARALDNLEASLAGQGAGIQAAWLLADQGIQVDEATGAVVQPHW
jgi:predicted Fe-Mo cluster-binding NifX family protein